MRETEQYFTLATTMGIKNSIALSSVSARNRNSSAIRYIIDEFDFDADSRFSPLSYFSHCHEPKKKYQSRTPTRAQPVKQLHRTSGNSAETRRHQSHKISTPQASVQLPVHRRHNNPPRPGRISHNGNADSIPGATGANSHTQMNTNNIRFPKNTLALLYSTSQPLGRSKTAASRRGIAGGTGGECAETESKTVRSNRKSVIIMQAAQRDAYADRRRARGIRSEAFRASAACARERAREEREERDGEWGTWGKCILVSLYLNQSKWLCSLREEICPAFLRLIARMTLLWRGRPKMAFAFRFPLGDPGRPVQALVDSEFVLV